MSDHGTIERHAEERDRQQCREQERRVEETPAGEVDEDAQPRSAPAPSATMAPTTASVTATRRPPRIWGSAAGISTVLSS